MREYNRIKQELGEELAYVCDKTGWKIKEVFCIALKEANCQEQLEEILPALNKAFNIPK